MPVFRNLAKKKLSFCKISNFIRNQKTNLLPYYECMEEDFLLDGKGNTWEYLGIDLSSKNSLSPKKSKIIRNQKMNPAPY